MKKAVLFVVIIGLLSSCKKDNTLIVAGITAVKDGTVWNTTNVYTGFKPLETKDTLFIVGNNREENIVIALKQKGVGTYQPSEFKAYFYATVGLDVIVGRYQLYDDPANSIVITDYDETTHVIKGTFNLTLKNIYNYNNGLADKIIFNNGKINTQLSAVYLNPFR